MCERKLVFLVQQNKNYNDSLTRVFNKKDGALFRLSCCYVRKKKAVFSTSACYRCERKIDSRALFL